MTPKRTDLFAQATPLTLTLGAAFAIAACSAGASAIGSSGSSETSPGESSAVGSSGPGDTTTSTAATGGGPPPAPCPNIKNSAGAWENITPPDVLSSADHATLAFALHPKDPRIVYVGTSRSGLFKTTDCGATWKHVNTGTNGAMLDQGMMGTMLIDPNDPDILYVDNRYGPGGLFRSKDGGVDWEQVFQPVDVLDAFIYGGMVEWAAFDPADSSHIVVSPHFSCASPHTTSCMIEGSGDTWHVIENTAPMDELGGQVLLDSKTWLLMTQAKGIFRTTDGGATFTQVYMGSALPSLYHGLDGAYYVAANNAGVLRSMDTIHWEAIANSPSAGSIAGSGDKLFISAPFVTTNYALYTIGGKGDFKTLPKIPTQGGGWMIHYDPNNGILYSSNFGDGFWRLVVN
jgi:hypothetical protein